MHAIAAESPLARSWRGKEAQHGMSGGAADGARAKKGPPLRRAQVVEAGFVQSRNPSSSGKSLLNPYIVDKRKVDN